MARKKAEELEVSEAEPSKKPGLKTVEAKHTVVYSEPITVPTAEIEAEVEVEDIDDESEESESAQPRVPSLRTRLRNKLAKNGIGDTEQLRLRIDRLPSYDQNGQAGINAEKEFVRTTTCTESFFTTDEYLEYLRTIPGGGPGTYWLTLRHKNNIVASWQERIAGTPQPDQSTVEGVPVVQNGTVDPTAMMDAFMKQFEKFQKFQTAMLPPWMRQANSSDWAQPPQIAQSNTTENALLTLINSDDELLASTVGKLKKLLRGGDGIPEEKGPWDAVVALLTSPTLPQTISMIASQFQSAQPQPNGQHQPPQPQQPPPDVAMLERLTQIIIETMKMNGDVAPVIRALDGLVTYFPQHQFTADNLMNAPTQQLLATLPQMHPAGAEAVALPHAAEWIDRLKAEYFGDSGEPE